MLKTALKFRWLFPMVFCILSACSQTSSAEPSPPPPTAVPATETFTPPPTPTPSPTPTQDPQESLEIANRAFFNGDWDISSSEYQRVMIISSNPDDLSEASLGLSKVYLFSTRYLEAVDELNTFLSNYADYGLAPDGHFLRATAFQALGEDDLAIEDFKRYLEYRPGILTSYVEEMIGDAQRRQGRALDAIPHYQRALEAAHLGGTFWLELKVGNSYLEAGDYPVAFAIFEQLFTQANRPATKAALNLLMGRALEAMGDFEGAYALYLDSVNNYPAEIETYLGLVSLVSAGVQVDDFQRGLVDYYAEEYEPALDAFSRAIATTPSGSAFYYQGLIRRELEDPWRAIANFVWVIDSYPEDPHWTDAWWEKAATEWRELSDFEGAIVTLLSFIDSAPNNSRAAEALDLAAYLSEWQGFLKNAEEIWMRIADEYPNHSLAFRGAFMSGITRYRLQNYSAARDAFLLADALSSTPGDRAAARFWVGKTHQAEGDLISAEQSWRTAADADPTGYYSVRSLDHLSGSEPFEQTYELDFEIDWTREQGLAEEWLRRRFGIRAEGDLSELDDILASDSRLHRGEEFWRLGLFHEAKLEFESLRNALSHNAERTYRLLHKLLDLGLYQPAIFASRQILDLAGMDDAGTLSAPDYFNFIRFGTYYDDLIFPVAKTYDMDVAFVLSVVRQESLFEGFITSYADARGLMQVIPPTGQEIAAKLGWPPGYTDEDLYRPHVSVRFGIDYLAEQRDRYDGDLYAALAAYNAGHFNATPWKELAPDDPDLFFEIIRIDQPQIYIRSIYEFFNIYKELYVGE
ncbi:MAG: transglycosylase SLT domain-containing protein [Anaerolineales bacterium]|nr:transglycosylase SLT domain-containing protein [Anaerolineales bacterium]